MPLVEAARSRRLLPFVGAGFSAIAGLPAFATVLERLCDEFSDIPFHELSGHCHGDSLLIAEYLLIRAGGRMGPLQRLLIRELSEPADTLSSDIHLELANLGSAQVYTTNYDHLIERTFRSLGMPVDVLALPDQIVTSSGTGTQVVKFHGDLDYEETLVLTESSYHARLDLDSPLDIKLRSDILGRTILFMGYSFSDVNVRLIWRKLRRLMRDIPDERRPVSYIVRRDVNPVLDAIDQRVGLRCIPLSGPHTAPADPISNLADFLVELTVATSSDRCTIPGTSRGMFQSQALISRAATLFEPDEWNGADTLDSASRRILDHLGSRTLLPPVRSAARDLLQRLARLPSDPLLDEVREAFALNYVSSFGRDDAATSSLVASLLAGKMAHAHAELPTVARTRKDV